MEEIDTSKLLHIDIYPPEVKSNVKEQAQANFDEAENLNWFERIWGGVPEGGESNTANRGMGNSLAWVPSLFFILLGVIFIVLAFYTGKDKAIEVIKIEGA